MDLAKARPMLDELKKGQWPSFVKEIEKSAAKNEQAATLLDLLEEDTQKKGSGYTTLKYATLT